MAYKNNYISSSFQNIPFTLQEAIDIEHQPHHCNTEETKKRRRKGRIDIIGIVLKVLFEVLWKKVTFVITDSSIISSSNSSFVKVILFGANVLSNVMNGTIQQGDAVRFNDLRPLSNKMEFYSSSWKDRDVHTISTTCTYFKLGRVCRITNTIDITEERLVPTDMITPRNLVYELLHWYLKLELIGIDKLLFMDTNNYDSSAIIGPCKRRQLCEITLPNLLSDIMVQVHSYTTRKDAILFFVKDGEQEEDVATLQLFRNGNHFSNLSSILFKVCSNNQNIFVRQLLSQSIVHDFRATNTFSTHIKKDGNCNDIILLTTHATTITIVEQHEPSNQLLPDENDHCCSILSTTFPNSFCISTQKLQAKLWNIYFYDLDSYLFNNRNTITKKTAIDTNECITSLLLQSSSSLESISDNNTAKFRPTAIFLLDCCDNSWNTTALSNDKKIMSVRANEDIMELLCGVSAQELSNELPLEPFSTSQGEASSQEKREFVPSLSILLVNMLFALVQEEMLLTWLLEQREDGDWHVLDIRLPVL